MLLALYEGENQSLQNDIREFEHALNLLARTKNVRVKIRSIDNLEARLVSIIDRAIECEEEEYEKKWLVANRREINTILNKFNQVRTDIAYERVPVIEQGMKELQKKLDDVRNLFATDKIKKAAAKANALLYAVRVGASGAVATGISAFSFFAGPVVGGVITGSVGGASLVATGGASLYGGYKGAKEAPEKIEQALRAEFRFS